MVFQGLVILCMIGLLLVSLYPFLARQLFGIRHPTVFGYSTAIVVSGSMAEAIDVNDVVVIRKEAAYAPEDIVSYVQGDLLITHRIVAQEGDCFRTKGDANDTVDPSPVHPEQIVGKVVLILPKIGAVISLFHTPAGMAILFLAAVCLLLLPANTQKPSGGGAADETE